MAWRAKQRGVVNRRGRSQTTGASPICVGVVKYRAWSNTGRGQLKGAWSRGGVDQRLGAATRLGVSKQRGACSNDRGVVNHGGVAQTTGSGLGLKLSGEATPSGRSKKRKRRGAAAGSGGDGGERRVRPAAVLLRAGAAVAARRLRRLRAGRHVGAGRAVRPRGGAGQPGAPGPGGARGAAAAQGGAARGAGAPAGAAAARDVRGRAAGGAAPPLGRHAGAARARRRRLPALVLPQRRLPGAAGRRGPALRPVLRRHLRPRPRRDPRPGPHHAPGAGRPRRAHVRHRQRGAEGAGGFQQGQLLRRGDAALPGGGSARRGLHLRLLPRLRPPEILQVLTPAVPQRAVNSPRPPHPRLSVRAAPRGAGHGWGTPKMAARVVRRV